MRQSLLRFAIFIAVFLLTSSAAQTTSRDTSFFLIENSESMWEFRDDAVADVKARVDAMGSTDLVSVKIFAGDNITDCDALVSIDPPSAPPQDLVLDPPASGGSTIVSNALQELLDNHELGGASIIVYTDGKYNAPSCESAISICEKISRIDALPNPPYLEFILPGLRVVSPKTFLNCKGPPASGVEGSNTTLEGIRFIAAAFFWLALPFVLFAYLALQNLSMRRYTHDVLQLADEIVQPIEDSGVKDISTSNPLHGGTSTSPKITTKKKTTKEKRRECFLLLVLLLSVVAVASIPERLDALGWLWRHGNDRLPAGIVSASIPAMAAWYLVELYRTGDARRHWRWQLSHLTIEQENIAKEISSQLSRIALKQEQYERRLLAKIEAGLELADKDTGKRISALASKVEAICGLVDEKLVQINDAKLLKNLKPSSLGYYSSVCRFLYENKQISSEDRKSINSLLVDWEGLLRSLPTLDEDVEARLLSFETTNFGNADTHTEPTD